MQLGQEALQELVRAIEESTAASKRAEEATREAITASNGAKAAANATTKEIQRLTNEQKVTRVHVDTLWKRVFGTDPPKPEAGVDPSLVPVEKWSLPPIVNIATDAAERSETNSGAVSELEGKMIAGFAALQTELREQSNLMGIGKKGADFVFSKAGQRAILRTVTAVGALLAAFATMASACRSPAPPLSAPVAQQAAPTVIFLPAPTTSADAGATQ